MRVAFLSTSQVPSRSANSIHVMKLCQAYARLGYTAELVVPEWKGGTERGVEDPHLFYGVEPIFSIRKLTRPAWLPEIGFQAFALPRAARSFGADLVHTLSLAAALTSSVLLHRDTIFELHLPPDASRRQRHLFSILVASSRLRAIVVITHALAERIRPLLAPGTRLLVEPDGVDESWLETAASRTAARERLGLTNETRRIAVYAGHLYPGRGIELILELAGSCPDHLFVIAGGRAADIERHREQSGNRENVRFIGFRPPAEVPLLLRAADVLLMPYEERVETIGGKDSAQYASPMKLFEYMAAGRPILASTLPVLGEILADERDALLLPAGDAGAWRAALTRLSADSELADRLGRTAREEVRRYTWERRTARILEAIGVTGKTSSATSPSDAGRAAGS